MNEEISLEAVSAPSCLACVHPWRLEHTPTPRRNYRPGARHVPVGWTVLVVCVANQGETHSWTVPMGRGSKGSREGTAGTRGAGLVFGKTRIALLANFWLTRAPGRAFGGRAAVARLPKSYATACDLDSAHAPLLATTHPMNCRHP